MTQEAFIEILKEKGYPYEIQGDKILVTHRGDVNLMSLETLPPGVEFENDGVVWLRSLKTLPPGVHFKNEGDVKLSGLGWVEDNKGIRIDGVDNKRLLHLMIKKELFI